MEKKKFFDNPLFRTKITSANVKPKEMLLGYFIAPFCALISNAIFGSYLNRYYSDVLGWTDKSRFGVFSAILPMISVIFVIIGNLVVGHLMDNTRTSQGKARPYMLLSAPLVTVAIALLFLTPENASPVVQMAWIAISYNVYYAVAYPFYYTAHSSLVALSTRNSNHRGMLATFSNASGVAAVGVGASILVPILLQSFLFVDHDGVIDTTASYNNWRIVMVVLCVVTFLAILLEYFFTRERITEENIKLSIKEEKLPMSQQIKACVSSKYWWIIILYFLLFQFGGLVKNGSMSYYARWMFDGINTEAAAGTAMGTLGLIGGLPTAIGMVLAWPIADKLGKQRAVTLGLVVSVVGGLVSFINVHSFTIVCAGVVGEPIFALGVGTIIAIYGLVRKEDNKKVIGIMDTAIKDTGIIMLITGAGGSLGNVIKVSGIGNVLGETVVGLPLPAILIPFIIAALMRIALGSATVAITTAASLTAPLMAAISVSPILLAASCCVGAISFSYFNDSGFWVFNGMFGLTELKDQVRCKTAVSLIMAGVGIIELLLLQFVL